MDDQLISMLLGAPPEVRSQLLAELSGYMTEPGNIDLTNRPRVANRGKTSTVLSAGYNINGDEVLLPRVSNDGRILTHEEAVREYLMKGRHLGKFSSPAASDAYAQQLHLDQEKLLGY